MEILERFDFVWQDVCPSDVQFPEPRYIWVTVNADQIVEITNAPERRGEATKKVRIIREAFRGCNAAWEAVTWNDGVEFLLTADPKANRKWARVQDKLASISCVPKLELKKAPEQIAYERRLQRRINRILDDPVEREDAFRVNTIRRSSSQYNYGNEQALKEMATIYKFGSYSALGKNEYWWDSAIRIHREYPTLSWHAMNKVIYFKKDYPDWDIHFAFDKKAREFVLKFVNSDEFQEDDRPPFIRTSEFSVYQRAHEIVSQPDDVVNGIPYWALKQILGSDEPPVFWTFQKWPKSNATLEYLASQKGAIDAVRKYTGIKDLPKKVAGSIFADIINNHMNSSGALRKATGISKETVRYLPCNWSSWALFQWLAKKCKNAAMVKDHIVYGPAGRHVSFTYMDKLDELQVEDLVNGVNTKPDTAFERAARRFEEKARLDMGENMKFSPAPFKTAKGIHQLMDSDSLKEEGSRMHNCVSGYAGACLRNVTYIFHVNVENDDATMEVTAERRMLQLYAPHNSEPSESVRKLAFKWAKANAIDVTDCNRRN